MSSYTGPLKIAATADVIDAVFRIESDQLEVTSGNDRLGSYPIHALNPQRRGDGVHLVLDGEDVVVNVADLDAFVSEIAPPKTRKRSRRQPKAKAPRQAKQTKTAAEPMASDLPMDRFDESPMPSPKQRKSALTRLADATAVFHPENWKGWLSDTTVQWVIASVAVIALALMVLFATDTFGMILVLLGMVSLIIAALAVSDDLSAYSWIPGNLSETTLVIIGAVAMVLGGILIVIG